MTEKSRRRGLVSKLVEHLNVGNSNAKFAISTTFLHKHSLCPSFWLMLFRYRFNPKVVEQNISSFDRAAHASRVSVLLYRGIAIVPVRATFLMP